MTDYSRMILIFGLPRSGTTWIAKFFDSHRDTLYRHEPDRYERLEMPPFVSPASVDEYRGQMADYPYRIRNMASYRVCAKLPFFKKSYLSPTQLHLYRLSACLARAGSKLTVDSKLLYVPRPDSPNVWIVWKSINSVGRIGLIAKILDGCKTLLVIRHPCGQISSRLKTDKVRQAKGKRAFSDDYPLFEMIAGTALARRHGLEKEQFDSLTAEERYAWQWVVYNDKALDELSDLPHHYTVPYEQVCLRTEELVREMFDYVGLEVGQSTEDFVRESTGRHDESYFSVYKDPRDSAYKWKHNLSQEQIDRITAITRRSRAWKYCAE
jgi:hypothetical protein